MSDYTLGTLEFFFAHVGERGYTCEAAFSTAVSRGFTLSEQRRQLIKRPKIRMNMQMFANDRNKAHSLQMYLMRMGVQRFLAPLFADQSTVTAHTGTTITCTTTYRRFEAGKQIAIYDRQGAYEVAEVTAVGGSDLTVDEILGTYTGEVYVVPLVECELLPDEGGVYRFAKYYSASATAIGRVGPMAYSPIQAPNTNPTGWPTHAGLPVFDAFAHMRHVGDSSWARDGEIFDLGLGSMPVVRGARPVAVYNMRLEFLSRQKAWEYLEFAHSRAGRAYPFWCVSPSEHFTLVNTGTITNEIDVESIGLIGDWASYRTHIGIVEKDGTVTIIDLADTTITRLSGVDTLTLDTPISILVNDIDRVSVVRKCRYENDVVAERWEFTRAGTTRMRSDLRCVELLEEKNITIANLDEFVPAPKGDSCDTVGLSFGDFPPTEPDYYLLGDCEGLGFYKTVTDASTTFSHSGAETSWSEFTIGEVFNLSDSTIDAWEYLGSAPSNVPVNVTVYEVGVACGKMYAFTPCGGGTVLYDTADFSDEVGDVVLRTSDDTCYTVSEVLNTGQTVTSFGSFTATTGCEDAACEVVIDCPPIPTGSSGDVPPAGFASSYTIAISSWFDGGDCSSAATSQSATYITASNAWVSDDMSLSIIDDGGLCKWQVGVECEGGGGEIIEFHEKGFDNGDPTGGYTFVSTNWPGGEQQHGNITVS